ncbi:OmpA family protein [Flavobacterium sp. LaA7.5]|nr:OmpA family protein [Flavobacterium salilacus subsp. altitudinum]
MKKLLFLLLLTINTAQSQDVFIVYFDSGLDKVNADSKQKLAEWITKNKAVQIQKIYGYTDDVGTDDYNTKLSKRRVNTVSTTLKNNGLVIFKGVDIQAFGETNAEGGANEQDRRVEIYYVAIFQSDVEKKILKSKTGDKVRLPNVNFYENSVELIRESETILQDLLFILEKYPLLKIQIQGHVCCQPENEERLSFKRAEVIYQYLIENGIDKERLSHTGFGSTKPIYPLPEKNEEERVANRRVEIEIVDN